MKKWAIGLLMVAASVTPAFAALGGSHDIEIRINGNIYNGTWAYIDDRIFVNVDSFARLMGLPHHHNALNWQLTDTGKGNPYMLSVDASASKIPTVRFGGATMVDLQKACAVLKVPVHHDFETMTYDIGTPYSQEYVVGAYYRKTAHRNGNLNGASGGIMNSYDEDGQSWSKDKWHGDSHMDEKDNVWKPTH